MKSDKVIYQEKQLQSAGNESMKVIVCGQSKRAPRDRWGNNAMMSSVGKVAVSSTRSRPMASRQDAVQWVSNYVISVKCWKPGNLSRVTETVQWVPNAGNHALGAKCSKQCNWC